MRSIIPIIICACLALSGCETTGGDGYITHSDHNLTAPERAAVTSAMQSYLKVPITISGLAASYDLNTSAVIVCGYVSGLVAGKPTPPSIFGGTLSSQSFMPLKVGGKGQDPQRIATVRAFCRAAHVGV